MKKKQKKEKLVMLTKTTTPITFFKMFETMRGGSTVE